VEKKPVEKKPAGNNTNSPKPSVVWWTWMMRLLTVFMVVIISPFVFHHMTQLVSHTPIGDIATVGFFWSKITLFLYSYG